MNIAKRTTLLLILTACSGLAVFGQAKSSASRTGDLQVGVGYTNADSDYLANRIRGLAFYADFDIKEHFGVEVDFHQLNDPMSSQVYERTYEFGGRYVRHYGRFHPYGKFLYGRGVFNFPYSEANLAYNEFVAGGGVDISVYPRINVRLDYEYERWLSFPPDGLTPSLLTVGVAYHFPAGRPR